MALRTVSAHLIIVVMFQSQLTKDTQFMSYRAFAVFSEMNLKRCEHPNGFNHKLNSWSTSDWMTATLGELGEAANIVKKLNRVRDGIPGNKETESELKAALADEIADTYIYLDLLAQSLGLIMSDIVDHKFRKTSKKIGYETHLQSCLCPLCT